jgi:hypothetical protein
MSTSVDENVETKPKFDAMSKFKKAANAVKAANRFSMVALADDDHIWHDSDSLDEKIIEELKALYYGKVLPIERLYHFSKLHSPEILESEMSSKPNVLLIGQYSTGKTTFIRHLIGCDYPDMHIGPEPTTDKFIAVVYGPENKTINGNALTGVSNLPFGGLNSFGTGFLNKFSAAVTPSPLLQNFNIIDTPGVLSGEKQRLSRGYDFPKVAKWFAERTGRL